MKIKPKQLWEEFGDIPISDEDEIEERFLFFEIGTHRFVIYHWFEDEFNLSVVKDLMNCEVQE